MGCEGSIEGQHITAGRPVSSTTKKEENRTMTSEDMNEVIRAALGRSEIANDVGNDPARDGLADLRVELDGRFAEEFGDGADRSAPRDDAERARAEHFARVEARAAAALPGAPGPLPASARSTGSGRSSGTPADFNDVIRAQYRASRFGNGIEHHLHAIESERRSDW
jgi:hypothetical protein